MRPWLTQMFPRRTALSNAWASKRWVVLDIETTGFDIHRDRLAVIGAVAMHVDGTIVPSDSMEAVLRQTALATRPGVTVGGLELRAQETLMDPEQAIGKFVEFAGECPLLAFHAGFDRSFLTRAVKVLSGRTLDNPWLDVAEVAPALNAQATLKSLDEWLHHYGIDVPARPAAAADAFATAMLAAQLLSQARHLGVQDFKGLKKLVQRWRWNRVPQ